VIVKLSSMTDIEQYDYELPKELIAQVPLPCRSDARLLVVDRRTGHLEDGHIRDLGEWVKSPDCLVFNDTRVVPARLVGLRERTGGRWHGLYLQSDSSGLWEVLCKTRGKLKAGEDILVQGGEAEVAFRLRLISPTTSGSWLAMPDSEDEVLQLLQRVGRVPLPPYIRQGEMESQDIERYQTVFATRPGAVAAPTAGLHFTPELLTQLRDQQIGMCRVTLHVGIGTFRPIAVSALQDHDMHSEWGEVDEETTGRIQQCREQGGRVVAVGTTVVRVLETASAAGRLAPWSGETRLFIRPPYDFRSVDALLTNFHLPRSTLLVLIRTFGGDELMRSAYQHAIQERYRFYSYGDAMLIL
jgi:S-adenosylmethionine:tRNA ribosyltransferase-isomerase